MLQPKDKDWLNGYKNKTPTYVVYTPEDGGKWVERAFSPVGWRGWWWLHRWAGETV